MSEENGIPDELAPEPAVPDLSAGIPTTDQVVADLREFYAAVLEYPREMVNPDTNIEFDLGVDSMQQTELLVRVVARYGLEPEEVNASVYLTLTDVADYVVDRLKSTSRT
ncbi:acyl carrier protein [Amycolatopsis sp. NPDC051102]|uniref:acyl carrier protein n=1 Tax=Amycolatopsis sp. NPDC051102 TaxID=3155163 RepID=UPI00341E2E89